MTELSCEGLVLHTLDYKDSQKIVTLFTPCNGKLSFLIKGLSRTTSDRLLFATALTRGEFVLKPGKGELFTFMDGSLLDTQLSLRGTLFRLRASMKILETLSFSQLPGKPAPQLYALTLSYLKEVGLSIKEEYASTLLASFFLKVLKHEGLFSKESTLSCSASFCEETPAHLKEGLFWCIKHAPLSVKKNAAPVSQELFEFLTEVRAFSILKSKEVLKETVAEIEEFFRMQILSM